jgi:hypothetical protein
MCVFLKQGWKKSMNELAAGAVSKHHTQRRMETLPKTNSFVRRTPADTFPLRDHLPISRATLRAWQRNTKKRRNQMTKPIFWKETRTECLKERQKRRTKKPHVAREQLRIEVHHTVTNEWYGASTPKACGGREWRGATRRLRAEPVR